MNATSKTMFLRMRAEWCLLKGLKTAKARAKRRASAKSRRAAERFFLESTGLTKVRGSVSGQTYYE